MPGAQTCRAAQLLLLLFVLSLKSILAIFLAVVGAGRAGHYLGWCVASSTESFHRFCAGPGFSFLGANVLPVLDDALDCDSEFLRSLSINLPCKRQLLSLLKFTNARPGTQTDDAVDLAAVVSSILQSLLQPLDVVRMYERRCFLFEVGSGSDG